MMARTQILKDIRPNIFLTKRKVFGILFLFFAQIVSAHIGIETEPNLNFEEETKASDSTFEDQKDSVRSEEKIYITSGTTIINLDDGLQGKIVIVEAEESKSERPQIAKKLAPKKVLDSTISKKSVTKNPLPANEYYYSSTKTDFVYTISDSFTKAVVPSADPHSKNFIKPIAILGHPIFENLKSEFHFDVQGVRVKILMLSSSRAPPSNI